MEALEIREEAEELLPDFWRYKVTASLIAGIKAGDRAAVREFFNANYDTITMCARKYYWKFIDLRHNQYCIDDYINQIYCDIPLYNYKNSYEIWLGMRLSCTYLPGGGVLCSKRRYKADIMNALRISLNAPVNKDSKTTYENFIPDSRNCFEQKSEKDVEEFEAYCMTIAARLFPFSKARQLAFFNAV